MRNIYKWWVKKNPVKKWNTVYTIVIQQSEIVKNQAQLQKYLAVPDIVYTLESLWIKTIKWCINHPQGEQHGLVTGPDLRRLHHGYSSEHRGGGDTSGAVRPRQP